MEQLREMDNLMSKSRCQNVHVFKLCRKEREQEGIVWLESSMLLLLEASLERTVMSRLVGPSISVSELLQRPIVDHGTRYIS